MSRSAESALTLRYVARTNVGLVRDGNEDSGYAGPRLLAVADGMGGHAAGEVASSAAIEELARAESQATAASDPLVALDEAVHAAHARIRQLVNDDPEREGMGTTVTALLWTGSQFGMAHIGDSRGYRLRDSELEQVTRDHTFVQALVDEGRITADQASVHPAKSMILRALQGDSDPQPDLEMLDVRAGDRLLLCSDGLTDYVSVDTIAETLVSTADLPDIADALVSLALRAGAPDNVTIVLADIVEAETPPSADDTAEAYLVGAIAEDEPSGPSATAARGLVGDPDAALTDPEALRYAPQPPQRFRWLKRIAYVAVAAAVVWAGAYLANDWIRSQYYVGDHHGEVAIFNGVGQEIGPIILTRHVETVEDLPVGALPSVFRDRVAETIPADNLTHAKRLGEDLRAAACASIELPATASAASPVETAQENGQLDEDGGPLDEDGAPLDQDGGPLDDDEPDPLPTAQPGYPGLWCPEDS